MAENTTFQQLVSDGRPTGEVVGVNRLLVTVRGLEGASVHSVVLFEDGTRGLVQTLRDTLVDVMALAVDSVRVGNVAVLEQQEFQVGVGEGLIGRVISPLGEPLDGKGPIIMSSQAAVFAEAPSIMERAELDRQLVTGVAIVDALFPFVLGQRIAVMGDNKTGKSTFLRQLTANQTAAGQIVVYTLIAKRQSEIDNLITTLAGSGALERSIVVVASSFDALSLAYLAPYIACVIAGHLWQSGRDVVVVYDDLSNHAKIYRELSLLAAASPGRDSYPGDMFFVHSALLERAGKLAKSKGTLTAIPVVLTPNDDITGYLPTNMMSITDGQIVFDMATFRKGIRPAVNAGISVSRVGGRVQSDAWKSLTGTLFKKLADYRQASEFAQFGADLAPQAGADLLLGKQLYEAFKQPPTELHGITSQYLILATILAGKGTTALNIPLLKQKAKEYGPQLGDQDPQALIKRLIQEVAIQVAR